MPKNWSPEREKFVMNELTAGKSLDFIIGRLFAMDNENRDKVEMMMFCSGKEVELNFSEVWAGIEFQKAVNSCIKNVMNFQKCNISDTITQRL